MPKNKKTKSSSVNSDKSLLSTLLLLFLSLGLLLTWSFYVPSVFGNQLVNNSNGGVLGDDDDEEEDEDEDEKDEAEDREEQAKKEAERKREEAKKRLEKDKSKTSETIINSDGTRTVVRKETEGDKSETKIVIYNSDGQKIEEREIKMEDGSESKVEIKTFAADGGKLSELKFRTEDDGGIKLEVKDENKTKTYARFDGEKNEVKVVNPEDDEDELLVRLGGRENEFEIEHEGDISRVGMPIEVDDDSGDVYLLASSGKTKLVKLPDDAVNALRDDAANSTINKIELKEKDNKIVYEITAEKAEKLFGLISVNIPLLMQYDATTGEMMYSSMDFRTNLLDAISF